METTLYHFPPSLCSQKVRLTLCEKGVNWQSRLINIGPPMENYEPWYARLNPGLVVPTLVIDGEPVTNSAHIIKEIDHRFEGPDLRADDSQVQKLIKLQDGLRIREMAYAPQRGLIGMITKGTFDKRLSVLKHHRDENPDLAPIYEKRINDVLLWKDHSHNPGDIEADRAAVEAALDIVTPLAQREFLVGNEYSLADVVWTVMLARLKFMGFAKEWPETRPDLYTYYQRMRSRPSFDKADIWERAKPGVMVPLVFQVLKMKLGLSHRPSPPQAI